MRPIRIAAACGALALAAACAAPVRAADGVREEPHITATISVSEPTASADFRKVHRYGAGFTGGLEIPIQPYVSFHGWLGLDHFPLDEEATRRLAFEQVGNAPSEIDGGGVNVITIMFGPRLQWVARPNLRPYVQGSLGVSYAGVDDLLLDGEPYVVDVEGSNNGQLTYGVDLGVRFGSRGRFGWTISCGWMGSRLSGSTLAWAPLRIGLITP